MTIYLVRISSVKAVLEATKKGKFKPKEDVIADSKFLFSSCEALMMVLIFIAGVVIKLNSDPDVEATAYGLSLKDPVRPFPSSSDLPACD